MLNFAKKLSIAHMSKSFCCNSTVLLSFAKNTKIWFNFHISLKGGCNYYPKTFFFLNFRTFCNSRSKMLNKHRNTFFIHIFLLFVTQDFKENIAKFLKCHSTKCLNLSKNQNFKMLKPIQYIQGYVKMKCKKRREKINLHQWVESAVNIDLF